MAYDNEAKKARQRIRPLHRWSKEESAALLEAMIDKMNGDPEKFEKPTASEFYTTLFEDYDLDVAELGVGAVKNKVRNMKDLFIKAEKYREENEGKGEEDNVREYITKICPHYEMLQQIFGQRKGIKFPVTCDTENTVDPLFHEGILEPECDMKWINHALEFTNTSAGQHKDTAEQSNESAMGSDVRGVNDDVSQKRKRTSVENFKLLMKKPRNVETNKRPSESLLKYFTLLQEKKNKINEKTMERQLAVDEDRLNIEKAKIELEQKKIELQNEIEIQKLEFEKEKFRSEFQLRKQEIEMQYELKKFELELQHKNKDD